MVCGYLCTTKVTRFILCCIKDKSNSIQTVLWPIQIRPFPPGLWISRLWIQRFRHQHAWIIILCTHKSLVFVSPVALHMYAQVTRVFVCTSDESVCMHKWRECLYAQVTRVFVCTSEESVCMHKWLCLYAQVLVFVYTSGLNCSRQN